MRRGTILVLMCCILPLCLGVVSCRKVGTSAGITGQLKQEKLKALDAIPVDYGNLVQVTSNSAAPDWAQLWFEKADRTIVVVKVNFETGEMAEDVLAIPRR
jgi:hypothetical protein